MFASRKRKASDEADSPPSRHLSPLHRVLHHPDQYHNQDQNKDQDPRTFSSYSSFHAYSHSHSPSPIPHHRPLPSASPDKTPHRALPSRGYPSQNSRSLSIASLLNNEAPAPPSPEPEYSIHLPPIRNPAFSASPSIGVDDDCDDDADSDDMTRLKTGSNKASEDPRRRVPSAISPVSSTSHSVGTSAEPPQSLGSVTPNAREQAHRDRIKARKTLEAAAKEEELIAKPPTCSISVTNKPRMTSPDVFVRETASLEKVVQVATHMPVPADRNVGAKEERPSYDNDNDSEETDLFVRDDENSVSSKCDTPTQSVTPETETIPQASTQIAVETVTETAPAMVAGPTEAAPSEESITKQFAEGAAKSERAASTNERPHENQADDPARVHTPATTNDDSSDDDVPLSRARRPGSSKGRESNRWTYSRTEKKRGAVTPATSLSGRMNSGIVTFKETHDGKSGTLPAQASAGRKTLPTTSQSVTAHQGYISASQTPIPSVEGSGHKRVLIPARRALENLGHTADIKSSSERSKSQKAVTPSEDSSAAPEAKIPSVKALSAVADISREPEPSKKSSVDSEIGHITDTYTQNIDPTESDESGDVDMFSTEVPTAPEANMRVSPDLQLTENKESTQVTKSASKGDTMKNAEPTKSPEPDVAKPEKLQPEYMNRKSEAPRIVKPKNVEHQSAATLPIKPSPRIKIVKRSPTKDQPRPQPSANVHIIGHRKMAKGDYDFELHLKEGNTTWWDEEVDLFSESPEIVSDYWNSVRGGRERACDGMWKIWKIFDERKVGNRKESLVGWLGTMDRTWEPKAYVRANALDVLKEWEQGKTEKDEASHMAWDGPEEEEEEDSNDGEPLKETTRKRATPTKARKGQAYKVKKPRRSAQ